jgi:asparagine synthase (glutamine-hydrolysing)
MCGIAGIVAWDERFTVTADRLARMAMRLAHRGPDGQGSWISSSAPASRERPQAGLAFRRLAVLDPDPRAMQPMHSPDGRYTLVFNGEIYNFHELRRDVARVYPGHPWRTSGDSEVLLMSYAAFGADCVRRLNGMFAFAAWDARDRSLLLARDRTGQKPLFYAPLLDPRGRPRVVAFASELSPLLELPWVDDAIEPRHLESYLRFGYLDRGATIFQTVYAMPPAHVATYHADRDPGSECYFNPTVADDAAPPAFVTPQAVRGAVETAVSRQLVSDVPLGCFLSGGIDSSILALCMTRAAGRGRVQTFSIGFDDPRYDETAYAEEVATHLGTEHRAFTVRPNAADDLPALAAVFGEPFADSSALPTHYLARETRRHVTVALSGDGGDELFGGYDRYRAVRLAARFDRLPHLARLAIAKALLQLPGTHPRSKLTRLKRLAASLPDAPGDRYARYVQLFDERTINRLLRQPQTKWVATHLGVLWEALAATRDAVATAVAIDKLTYLPGDLHTKVDRASMLHSLEVRAPFMDLDLLKLTAALDARQLVGRGSKRLLREAFSADLPPTVFKRPKAGFAVPIGEWFRGELRDLLRDALFASTSFASARFDHGTLETLLEQHERRSVDHSQRLYALLMLELWWSHLRGLRGSGR